MGKIHTINELIAMNQKSKVEPRTFRPFVEKNKVNMYEMHGDGIYLNFIESRNNNPIAKGISFISGPFSHVVATLHSDNIQQYFDEDSWIRMRKKFINFYKEQGVAKDFLDQGKTKTLVMASSDQDGHNYFDFGSYQKRDQMIVKLDIPKDLIKNIVIELCNPEIMYAVYDYIGLIGWMLSKIECLYALIDDERAFYCSEVVYEVLKHFNVFIAKNSEPSPTEEAKFFFNKEFVSTGLQHIITFNDSVFK